MENSVNVRAPGQLFLGEAIEVDSGDRTGTSILLESADLTTHGVIVGMTGSGKTGLGVVLLEEALTSGIPVLAIDPKGDLGNLCLTFPGLSAQEFEPWMDAGSARVDKTTVQEMAVKTAEVWTKGLGAWGMGPSDLSDLAAAADPVIYTPGSDAGIPLNVLGRLSVPQSTDPSVRQDEVDATVGGLLSLIGVQSDPISGREHILLTNLIIRSWDAGTDMDLATLLGQLMDPPIRKLGILDLDTFFPPKDRQALAMKLNGLLASPSFAGWSQGAPLEMGSMLWKEDGTPRAAIVSLGHLDEAERQFAITIVLSRLISWMRNQPGTGELRVLVYIDEVMGLAPPTQNPSTKKPILTLLKQARAFGVGLVLSTQNPVDLDYKAISNAGTWLIGRLQTEQDKNRLVDGLRSSDGSVDVAEVERMISGLGKRQFIMRTTRSSELPLLTTRWAMNYLAGPLTRSQIRELMDPKREALLGQAPSSGPITASAATASAASPAPAPASAPASPALRDDEFASPPATPDSLPTRYVHESAPWLKEVGAQPGSTRLSPALAARVKMLFDDTKSKLRHKEEWEAIIPLTDDWIDVDQAISVDFDDRDFTSTAPAGAAYVAPTFDLTASTINKAKRDLKDKLYTGKTITLFHNTPLKLWSRPGESEDEFTVRCDAAAEDGADAATEKIRARLAKKSDQLQASLAKAQDRVEELETQAKGRKAQNVIDIGTSLLGGLFGGRKRSRSLATAARRATSGGRQSSSIKARLETAENRVAEKIDDLEQLEAQLAEELIDIDDEWTEKVSEIETVEIPLEKTDIAIEDLLLVWIPASN